MQDAKKVLEAALFMAPRALDFNYFKKLLNFETKEQVIQTLRDLKADYDAKDSALEIFINLDDEKAMMRVKGDYLQNVKELATNSEFHEGLQKTLALIAFKQPVKQNLIVKYRNVKAYDHIHILEEKGFIKRIPAGKTFILHTTKKFSEYFNIDATKKEMVQKTAENPLAEVSNPNPS
ncbi:MAG: SMC-Scp complex subunit ScpB [archaeon]